MSAFRRLAHPPLWAVVFAGLVALPLYLKFFAWVLGGCVSFWAPVR